MKELTVFTDDQKIVATDEAEIKEENNQLMSILNQEVREEAILKQSDTLNLPENQKEHLNKELPNIEQISPYSPPQSEYGTPPRTPSELKYMTLTPKKQQSTSPAKDQNNNLAPTVMISEEYEGPEKTNEDQAQENDENKNQDEDEDERLEEKEPELTASPFSFSLQRSKENQQKKRSSYLEKRQSHMGLFFQTDMPTFGGSLSSIPKAADDPISPETSKTSDDSNIFRLTKVASTTRLNTLEKSAKLEPLDSSFRLLKIASAPKLNLLPPTKPLPKFPIDLHKDTQPNKREASCNQTVDLPKTSTIATNEKEDCEPDKEDEQYQITESQIPVEFQTTSKQGDKNEEVFKSDTTVKFAVKQDITPVNDIQEILDNVFEEPSTANIEIKSANKQDRNETSEPSNIIIDSLKPDDIFSPHANGNHHQENEQVNRYSSSSSTIKALSRSISNGSTLSPFSGSDDDTRVIKRDGKSVLEKQLSIKEYRMKKLQREGTTETSFSDDEPQQRQSDTELFSTVSSLADISDASVDGNISRNKRYSRSKKDLRHVGMDSSSSESDVPIRKTTGQRINEKLNHINRLANPSEPLKLNYSYRNTTNRFNDYSNTKTNIFYKRNWHSTGEDGVNRTERRRRYYTRTANYRSLDEY